MENKDIIKIIDEDGVEKEVEVINYFTLNSNGKDYMIYTENEEDSKGNMVVYTSEVINHGDSIELVGVDDEQIMNEIKQIMIEITKAGE